MKITSQQNETVRFPVAAIIFALLGFVFWLLTTAASNKLNARIESLVCDQVCAVKELKIAKKERSEARDELEDAKQELQKAKQWTEKTFKGRGNWMRDLTSWISESVKDRFTASMFANWLDEFFSKNPQLVVTAPPDLNPPKKMPEVPK